MLLNKSRINSIWKRNIIFHEDAECDLVLVKGGRPVAGIEIKYTSSPKLTRGLIQALQDINADQNYIITPGTDTYLINKKTRVCNLTTFLDKYLP